QPSYHCKRPLCVGSMLSKSATFDVDRSAGILTVLMLASLVAWLLMHAALRCASISWAGDGVDKEDDNDKAEGPHGDGMATNTEAEAKRRN
ncbi:hypothetical protein BOX15_Mlig006476g2, partial [Macrostomum lignano]